MCSATLVPFLVLVGAIGPLVSIGFAAGEPELLQAAEGAYRQGRYTEVLELASRVIEQDEQRLEAYRLRAAAYEALRRFDRAIADLDRWIELQPEASEAYQTRGEVHFKAGHVRASVANFDRFIELRPEREPHHWQRGISYYYAGQCAKGVRQFELHRTVNPQDVENAVWHYLCKARVAGVASARDALMDITDDRRPWASKVHQMFQGKSTPQQVLAHADRVSRTEAERRNSLFYAHLYVGLFHEAAGRSADARQHVKIAVERYPSPHYMGEVARVHLQLNQR
jgi:lipoprotein NlpI